MFIYPYYHLRFNKTNKEELLGLTNSLVTIQKKYPDEKTFCVNYDSSKEKLVFGDKKSLYCEETSVFRLENNLDLDFFRERENILFFGSILKKSIVLWDCWDIYNGDFLDTDTYITKYIPKIYYRGPYSSEIYDRFSGNMYVYRFKNPRLTYVC